jgi:hypothetical protein
MQSSFAYIAHNAIILNLTVYCLNQSLPCDVSYIDVNWLIDGLRFYVPLKNFSLIWRRHHYRWCLCSALRAFEQGGIFIVPHLLWHGASVFQVSSDGPPFQSPLTIRKRMWRTYSNPDITGPHLYTSCDLQGDAEAQIPLGSILTYLYLLQMTSSNNL